jgi:putative protease
MKKGLYLNARPNLRQYNYRVDEIEKLVEKADKIPVFVAMNEPYDYDEIPHIIELMVQLRKYGISGFIISSIPLLSKIENMELGKLIISSLALALNRGAIELYRELGVDRIILTRQNKLSEIEKLIKLFPELEFETFGFFDKCNNLDELCRTTDYIRFKDRRYKKEGCICHIAENHVIEGRYSDRKKELIEILKWRIGCSNCFIDRLKGMGVDVIKLASRGWSFEKKRKVLQMVKRVVSSEGGLNMEDEFEKLMGRRCVKPYDCYYRD